MLEPIIRRNTISVIARGRYEITYGGWTIWTFTLRGARRAARRLKRRADLHGTVITRTPPREQR